jgi:hypothetical protein
MCVLMFTFRNDIYIEQLSFHGNMISGRACVVLLIRKGDIFKFPPNSMPCQTFNLKDGRYLLIRMCMHQYIHQRIQTRPSRYLRKKC